MEKERGPLPQSLPFLGSEKWGEALVKGRTVIRSVNQPSFRYSSRQRPSLIIACAAASPT